MADNPSFIEVQKSLAGIGYPASKDDLVKYAQQHGAEEGIVQALQAMPDREYDGPSGVSKEITKTS
ncbi:DUF2795 domain-containing protein [Actinomadura sp. 7K507]|uniref:DUF2795 domain-containing protein n=1 Tax=Actinomadura sp. 7K507 TaxID=2530365 RepID=UPI00104426AB|nr:DUF2795 domain-containing protein [Actinomadura sp. 7K507]TDC84038.1 DUF2795 domain-containing protein [Actinomadura sp. 7K507]